MNAVFNKKTVATCGPIQGIELIPAFNMNGLSGIGMQGENFDWVIRSSSETDAQSVRREIPVKFFGFAVDGHSGKFRTAAGESIECRENEMRAIVRAFGKNTKRRGRTGAAKLAVRAGRQDRLRGSAGKRHAHNLRAGFDTFVGIDRVKEPRTIWAYASVGPIVRSSDEGLGFVSINRLDKNGAVTIAIRSENYILAIGRPV